MENNNLMFDNCENFLTTNGKLIKEKLALFIKNYINKDNYMIKWPEGTIEDCANHYVACYLFNLIAEDIVKDEKPEVIVDPISNIEELTNANIK